MTPTFVATLERDELCVRILEALTQHPRPDDAEASECMAAIDNDLREDLCRAADAVVGYLKECVGTSQRVQ